PAPAQPSTCSAGPTTPRATCWPSTTPLQAERMRPMSTPFSQFCDQVVRRVRWFPARGSIAAELRAHLEDHAAALMERGTPEEEAAQQAVAAMGDPEALGRQVTRAQPPARGVSGLVP